ncbi:MAG: hypothetical protein Q9174_002369 [Haloplaca sp. 1 TL-2023]
MDVTAAQILTWTEPKKHLKPTKTFMESMSTLFSSLQRIYQDFVSNCQTVKVETLADRAKRSGVYYNPFQAPNCVIVRSSKAIQELCEAPHLSQKAVYSDIFGLQNTIGHTSISFDPNEINASRLRLATRAIKIKGLAQLQDLFPYLQAKLDRTIADELYPKIAKSDGGDICRLSSDEYLADRLYRMVNGANYSLDETLRDGNVGSDEIDFAWAMDQYYKDTMMSMGILQLVPSFLRRTAYVLVTRNGKALDVLMTRLVGAIDSKEAKWEVDKALRSVCPLETTPISIRSRTLQVTLFQNMIEASEDSSYWTPTVLSQALLGYWFAASHQPWIVGVPAGKGETEKYVKLIRREIQEISGPQNVDSISRLPLLDSFIKESVRINPLDKSKTLEYFAYFVLDADFMR